ncbi:hypothetical protein B0H21DRAFT_729039 [Amylocystis lapponica]|nr:hypothetical protein B0H21DRAFT_729039 [Amylocystis lapponica]
MYPRTLPEPPKYRPMAPRSLCFIFEFYDMDDPTLLPTRLERVRHIPIRAPRPTLPRESFQAIIHGDCDSMRAESKHTHTREEVHALGQNLLDIILNPDWVDALVCCVAEKELHTASSSSRVRSSEPGTLLGSPTSCDCKLKHQAKSERTSTPSTSSWMDCLGSPADSAAESPAIHTNDMTTDATVCINIEACVLEARRMGWQHQWRAFIRQQVQCRLEAQDILPRDENNPARSVAPDRLGAWPPIIEA